MTKRLAIARALAVGVAATALISSNAYAEDSATNLALETGALVLLLVAAMGRLWSAAFITGKKSKVLVTDGPYSLVRNPLYFFSFLGFIGAGLAFESVTLAVVLAAVFFLTHWPTIISEERKLRELFGEAFDDYMRRVPRFVPLLRKPQLCESMAVSPRILTKAMLESSLVLCIFGLAHVNEWAHMHEILPTVLTIY